MKSLQDSAIREDIGQRLRRLSADSARQWGKMTVNQTVCHLADSYRMAVGDHKVADVSTLWTRTGLKWIVLYAPMPWPKGVRTFPELNQELGGTTTRGFCRRCSTAGTRTGGVPDGGEGREVRQ